jgi:hypothetical protein
LYSDYAESNNIENVDYDSYLIFHGEHNAKEILDKVRDNWNTEIEPGNLFIVPFKKSDVKRIRQTLELV